MKSIARFVLCALLPIMLLPGCATSGRSNSVFEYRIVKGYTIPVAGRPLLEPLLESAGADGWEAVSWSQDQGSPPYFFVLLKRHKR